MDSKRSLIGSRAIQTKIKNDERMIEKLDKEFEEVEEGEIGLPSPTCLTPSGARRWIFL